MDQTETAVQRYLKKAAEVIDMGPAHVLLGEMFKHHEVYNILAGATQRFRLVVPVGKVACLFKEKITNSGGPVHLRLYENAVMATAGTAITPLNANRSSAAVSVVGFYKDSTFSADGDQLEHHLIPSAKNDDGSGQIAEDLWLLGAGTYQFTITNSDTAAIDACLQIAWAETDA